MADETDDFAFAERASELSRNVRQLDSGLRDINRSATQFGRALSNAFAQGVSGSRSLDDVLKSLYLQLSDIALKLAFKPLETALVAASAGGRAVRAWAGKAQLRTKSARVSISPRVRARDRKAFMRGKGIKKPGVAGLGSTGGHRRQAKPSAVWSGLTSGGRPPAWSSRTC